MKFAVDAIDIKGYPIPESEKVKVECDGPEKVFPVVTKQEGQIIVSFDTNIRRGEFGVSIFYQGQHILKKQRKTIGKNWI